MDLKKLEHYINQNLEQNIAIKEIIPIVKGFSNLTYKIVLEKGTNLVLRRPPHGNKIKSAHDMNREYTIQRKLWDSGFYTIPEPVLYCNDASVLGDEFYLMKFVEGLTLKPNERTINANEIKKLSETTIKVLASLHKINIKTTGLDVFYRGEGYLIRQAKGWQKRYNNAKTDDALPIDFIAEWLFSHMPEKEVIGFIHNDFKYDNFIVNKDNIHKIEAIVDWEMATVGDVFSDLATTLSYWAEPSDHGFLTAFTISATQGNFSREEIIALYEQYSGLSTPHWLFYYVLSCLKLAGVVQQIYYRYKTGFTKDKRFKNMILIGHNCIENANRAIKLNRISNLY